MCPPIEYGKGNKKKGENEKGDKRDREREIERERERERETGIRENTSLNKSKMTTLPTPSRHGFYICFRYTPPPLSLTPVPLKSID